MVSIDLSIIVPVYNSDKSLTLLMESIFEVVSKMNISYEVVFIDDGSEEESTWKTLVALNEKYVDRVRCFRLTKNFGRPSAILCGFSKARGAHVLMMDDDLEHDPNYIPLFWDKREHDVVIASFRRKNHSLFKRLTSNIKSWFDYQLIDKPRKIDNSSYKLINGQLIEEINRMNIANPFISALLFSQTRSIINIQISHGSRAYGESGYSLHKMFSQFFNLIFNNSSFLLRVVSYFGISFSLGSILLSFYFIYIYFDTGVSIKGWTSLILLMLFTSGLTLFSLGVLGEYFIRIIRITERRPSYVVRESLEIKL